MKRCQGDKHNSTNLKDLGLWTNLSLLHRNEQVNFFTLKRQGSIDHNDVALKSRSHLFCEVAEQKRKGAQHLLKMQNQRSRRALFLDVQKDDVQKPWMHGSRRGTREELKPGLLGSACPGPLLCDFLENHFLDEEVKLIKKMCDHLTNLLRLAGPQVSLQKTHKLA
ncbi:Ferritin Light Chain [Manis pentadactyla]|nr:Ferritin Light Chain [Manis pentadactyla]